MSIRTAFRIALLVKQFIPTFAVASPSLARPIGASLTFLDRGANEARAGISNLSLALLIMAHLVSRVA
jgi:hypothetical protein